MGIEDNTGTMVAGGLGSLVGFGVMLTQNISNVIWVGGVLMCFTLVTVIGITQRYDEGFAEPLAGIVFVLSLSSVVALYALTQLALVGFPRFNGVLHAVGESVYNSLRLYIAPALVTAVLVEFVLAQLVPGTDKVAGE